MAWILQRIHAYSLKESTHQNSVQVWKTQVIVSSLGHLFLQVQMEFCLTPKFFNYLGIEPWKKINIIPAEVFGNFAVWG